MNKPTFKEQFDKLTAAYIHDQVNPYHDCACFVGNLLNGDNAWGFGRSICLTKNPVVSVPTTNTGSVSYLLCQDALRTQAGALYTLHEVCLMESLFLTTLQSRIPQEVRDSISCLPDGGAIKRALECCPGYEEALFTAFEVTLEALRKIHESKGEKVDDYQFTKRVKHEETNV